MGPEFGLVFTALFEEVGFDTFLLYLLTLLEETFLTCGNVFQVVFLWCRQLFKLLCQYLYLGHCYVRVLLIVACGRGAENRVLSTSALLRFLRIENPLLPHTIARARLRIHAAALSRWHHWFFILNGDLGLLLRNAAWSNDDFRLLVLS